MLNQGGGNRYLLLLKKMYKDLLNRIGYREEQTNVYNVLVINSVCFLTSTINEF